LASPAPQEKKGGEARWVSSRGRLDARPRARRRPRERCHDASKRIAGIAPRGFDARSRVETPPTGRKKRPPGNREK
jgi:hypothetical protein